MKSKNLIGTLLLILCSISFTACSDENEEGWYDRIPDGAPFVRANTLQFYYIDENGKSLINPEDSSTFPVSHSKELENPLEHTNDYNKEHGNYNGNSNWIGYDKEKELYYCTMSAYGDERQSTYSFPVYVNGDVDRIEITYKYTDKDIVGGKYWSKIISWKYNGKHIYSDDDKLYKKIFIKKSKGSTTVTTED